MLDMALIDMISMGDFLFIQSRVSTIIYTVHILEPGEKGGGLGSIYSSNHSKNSGVK